MASFTRKTQNNSRARRREEIQARLLQAVEELLSEGGSYAELSVERLVDEVGISRSTFYVYFEDKGDLLRAWFEQTRKQLEGAAAGWWSLSGDIAYEDVRRALEEITLAYRPHAPLMSVIYDAASYDTTLGAEVTAMMDANIAGLRRHIRKGQSGGWIAGNLPPAESAAWLTWMAERGFHRILRDAGDGNVDGIVDGYAEVVWNALYRFAPAKTDDRS